MNKCLYCGNSVKNKYCNVSCQNRHRNPLRKLKRIEKSIECNLCGNTFIQIIKESGSNFIRKRCNDCKNINNKREQKYCLVCNKEINRRNKYCSRNCGNIKRMKIENEKYLDDWKNGKNDGSKGILEKSISNRVRNYIKKKYDYKCCLCGWDKQHLITGNSPLHIDHIDGNYKNNKEENLRLICPNCHSLTPNFGSLNNGNGRKRTTTYIG